MATRFNRLRTENGHLFQGRYKGLLIEDFNALARVVDYIHLNPVRAKLVLPEQVAAYRWSSLPVLLKGPRPDALKADDWLRARGQWTDGTEGLRAYTHYLRELAQDEGSWEREGLIGLSRGWAIGTQTWRNTLAKEYAQMSLATGLSREERVELRQASWTKSLEENLTRQGKTRADFATKPRKQCWKIALAGQIRQESGASIAWLAEQLQLGGPATLRGYMHQSRRNKN